MLHAPESYLNSILDKTGIEKDISLLAQHFIKICDKNLHFIIDEKELEPNNLICNLCHCLNNSNNVFKFDVGMRLAKQKNPKIKYSSTALKALLSPYLIKSIEPKIELDPHHRIESLDLFIPISNYKIERAGNLLNRISAFQNTFKACNQSDYFSNEKLLVIGTHNLFKEIPKEYPACFVSENDSGELEIEYNSPLLPKISVLKNINLLDGYLQKEINGSNITFSICLFIGSSKFEHSINTIRNYYNQRRFSKAVFIGEKDIKLDLGNNQIPLRWKWTIPEINFFNSKRNVQHKPIVIHNDELERLVTDFFQAIQNIESKHTVGLKPIYRFIRRLYYDWNLKQEATFVKLNQIEQEFEIALKELLIETIGNIYSDFDFDEYLKPLSIKFSEIIKAVRSNNKTEHIKSYPAKIHQLIVPSFLCNTYKAELNQIATQAQHHSSVRSFQDISRLQNVAAMHQNNPSRNYYSLTADGTKSEILSLAKSNNSNEEELVILSSIYGSGKVERLIERLARAKIGYTLLLYNIEEKALQFHLGKYKEELDSELSSSDRFSICGVEYKKEKIPLLFDEWVEALASTKYDYRYTENYKIIFSDNSKIKLPSSKSVLKIVGADRIILPVEELSTEDKIQIYINPDKETLKIIFELKYPELLQNAELFSKLWRYCLLDYYVKNVITEKVLFEKLVENRFSVSLNTLRRYLTGQVMFPARYIDLIAITKTIQHNLMPLELVRTEIMPTIHEYEGKLVKEGFNFSEGINSYLMTGEMNEYLSQWYTREQLTNIVSRIEMKTIKDIELITQSNDD